MLKKLFLAAAIMCMPALAQAAGGRDTVADVYFKHNSSDLTPVAIATLENLKAKIQVPECVSLRIVGHACELGEESWNMDVGMWRAQRIQKWLASNGFNFDKIEVETVGESDPVVPHTGNPVADHIQHRVVEIYLLPRESWYSDFKCRQALRDQ